MASSKRKVSIVPELVPPAPPPQMIQPDQPLSPPQEVDAPGKKSILRKLIPDVVDPGVMGSLSNAASPSASPPTRSLDAPSPLEAVVVSTNDEKPGPSFAPELLQYPPPNRMLAAKKVNIDVLQNRLRLIGRGSMAPVHMDLTGSGLERVHNGHHISIVDPNHEVWNTINRDQHAFDTIVPMVVCFVVVTAISFMLTLSFFMGPLEYDGETNDEFTSVSNNEKPLSRGEDDTLSWNDDASNGTTSVDVRIAAPRI